jgi:purine-nucleoside phosphorylase
MLSKLKRKIVRKYLENKFKNKNYMEKLCWITLRCFPQDLKSDVILTDIDLTSKLVVSYTKKSKKIGKIFNVILDKKEFSVIPSGIGYPSALLVLDILKYSKVKFLIRFGWCGSLNNKIKQRDIFVPRIIKHNKKQIKVNNSYIINKLQEKNIKYKQGTLLTNETFVMNKKQVKEKADCIDMEAYYIIKSCNKMGIKTGCLLLVSDSIPVKET